MDPCTIMFRNYTTERYYIEPINSSTNRWQAFTLSPGEEHTISGSNSGRNNYDLEFRVHLNKKGTQNDIVIGDFRADNPWHGVPSMRIISDDVWEGMERDYKSQDTNGKVYHMVYDKDGHVFSSSRLTGTMIKGIYGKTDASKLIHFDSIFGDYNKYVTEQKFEAFAPNIPVARVNGLEPSNDSYRWIFALDDLH